MLKALVLIAASEAQNYSSNRTNLVDPNFVRELMAPKKFVK
jgi:hypothetical protein